MSCFQWFKDTNLKANHNHYLHIIHIDRVVSNGSKILIWKQITTTDNITFPFNRCFQWFKDTNLKANHNLNAFPPDVSLVVSNGSKILIWKQITTAKRHNSVYIRCFQWFKDTNLKANHNLMKIMCNHG